VLNKLLLTITIEYWPQGRSQSGARGRSLPWKKICPSWPN